MDFEGIAMDSNMRGGLGKSIGRMFSGESLFMATYKAEKPGAMIAFASTVAGEVLPIDVGSTGGMICQKGAPVSFVRNNPSPPKKMFFRPFTVSISYLTDFSKATTFPVSTLITSPGARFFSTLLPSISKNTMPFPEMSCKINPSPPNNPADKD